MQSPLSSLVLTFGGSLTLLLVLIVYFAQTARRKSQYAEYSASLLRATLESTADGLLALDRQGNVLTYNQKLVEIWHIPQFLLASRNGSEILKSCLNQTKYPQRFQQRIQELQDNPEAQSSEVLEFEDGRMVECCSQPEHLGGSIVGRVWNFRDVSERKRLEQQLRQAQKMEAVGRLAGGIAHDFNNILGVIIGYAELVLPRLPEGAALRSDAEQILQAAKRGTGLTRQLLTLSRRQVLQPELVDVNVVVSGMGKLLRRLISEEIELWMVLHPALARVQADIGQIEQVLMNLVLNARDAMPDGGKLTLSTANVEVDDAYARHEGLAAGQYVLVAVSDTGCGMSAETRSRLFEPFFTTKEQGKGTGLGLATVYGIVTQSGGHIRVDSEPGRGSTFKIYLPRVEEAKAPRKPSLPAEVVAGSETILLAEDEPGMRRLLSQALRTRGYTVLEASNGVEALEFSERHSGPIDLVLTDMLMPQMRGGELAAKVSAQRPEAKILYMSGYSDEVVQGDSSHLLLRKPFTVGNLLQRVQERLQN